MYRIVWILLLSVLLAPVRSAEIIVPNGSFEKVSVMTGSCRLPESWFTEPPVTVITPDAAYMTFNFSGQKLPDGFNVLRLGLMPTVRIWIPEFLQPNTTYKIEFDMGLPSSSKDRAWFSLDIDTRLGKLYRASIDTTGAVDNNLGQIAAKQGMFTHETLTFSTGAVGSNRQIGSQIGLVIYGGEYLVDNVKMSSTPTTPRQTVNLNIKTNPSRPEAAAAVAPVSGTRSCEKGMSVILYADDFTLSGKKWVFDRWKGGVDASSSRTTTVMMERDKTITAVYRPAKSAGSWDVKADSWVATDALGRKLPGYAECGPPRTNRYVGIDYSPWLGQEWGMVSPLDNTKIIAANPSKPDWYSQYGWAFYTEPELGYYVSDDEYVIRRDAYLLSAAGVDTICLDDTNSTYYPYVLDTICRVYRQIRNEGGNTPQICVIANASHVQAQYDTFYAPMQYPELWFQWQGKPLILVSGDQSLISPQVKQFFTVRQCWYEVAGKDSWDLLAKYPQGIGWHTSPNEPEEMAVAVATHPAGNDLNYIRGRSYHDGSEPPLNQYDLTGLQDQGLHFAEQWKRALKVDPQFIFIMGWNERVTMRFVYPDPACPATILGSRVLKKGDTFTSDGYNQEFSRDAAPTSDICSDNYYYQMVAGIRRFKGVSKPDAPGAAKTIAIDGRFGDWVGVSPEYRHSVGNTQWRFAKQFGGADSYINTTGRNDIIASKVARDSKNVYFSVKTREKMSRFTDKNWMLLYIDADSNSATGWNGYDYVVNSHVLSGSMTTLKSFENGLWAEKARIKYRVSGNQMELAIPRAVIGQNHGADVTLDFHWADNTQNMEDIREFFVSGESAPDRRANYRYDTSIR